MMKNYIYKWQVGGGLQWREVPEDKYTERQKEHKEFKIDFQWKV